MRARFYRPSCLRPPSSGELDLVEIADRTPADRHPQAEAAKLLRVRRAQGEADGERRRGDVRRVDDRRDARVDLHQLAALELDREEVVHRELLGEAGGVGVHPWPVEL